MPTIVAALEFVTAEAGASCLVSSSGITNTDNSVKSGCINKSSITWVEVRMVHRFLSREEPAEGEEQPEGLYFIN